MKRLFAITGLMVVLVGGAGDGFAQGGTLQQALAALPNDADVQLVFTDVLGDKRSIRSDLQVSQDLMFHLVLHVSVATPAKKKTAVATDSQPTPAAGQSDAWELVINPREWNGRETLVEGSLAEKKLIWLLRRRVAATTDAIEKQNAAVLAEVLMNHKQPYPGPASGRWVLRSATLSKKP